LIVAKSVVASSKLRFVTGALSRAVQGKTGRARFASQR
jgi:hypothetical protein